MDRQRNCNRIASAFTDAAMALDGCKIAYRIESGPDRFASKTVPAREFGRCRPRPPYGDVAWFPLNFLLARNGSTPYHGHADHFGGLVDDPIRIRRAASGIRSSLWAS
jgi:hypothetical protein